MKVNTTLEIDSTDLNNAIQSAISITLKQSDIKDKLHSYGTKMVRSYVDKAARDGRLVQSVAKEIANNISINEVLKIIDVEKLEASIIENISNLFVKQLNDKLTK